MKSILRQLLEYLYIRKRDPSNERTDFEKYMHGMNRISLLMFLIALIIMLFKLLILPLLQK